MLSVLTLGAWAQSSPYTGVAPGSIVSGNDYYLYNVESGLWLQNNDRTTNDWHTRGQLGTRGIDLQLNADGAGYKINAKFGRSSINHENLYLDANDNDVWVFESVTVGSVSNAVTISCSGTVLGARNYVRTYKAKNLFTEETESNYYLENQANEGTKNNTWQIVTKAERLEKMAAATESSPMDASWLVKSSDFANNDSRYSSWTRTGSWARGGDANGDWGRGSMIMESWNSGNNVQISQVINDVPNGKYELQLQGYYRDGMAGDNTDFNDRGCTNETCIEARHDAGTEVIRAKYFANATEADLRSIIDETHTSAKTGPDCWNFTRLGRYYFPNDMQTAQRAMNIEKAYVNDPIQVIVTDGILTIGVKKTGSAAYDWVILDNFKLTYLGPVVDLGPYLETLNNNITAAEAYNGDTTDALASALASALATAKAARSSEDTDELSQAAHDLHSALEAAEAADVSVLRPTVALAKAEGVDVSAQENYLANGTTNEVADRLRLVRNLRKLNAIEKVDITKITCSEPAEGDFYLYNVGAGIFFSTTSDWGTHIAIDNPGILIHFRPDGEWSGAAGRPVFHLSGNGWDGMNWQEEYWDKNGENKLAFVPVEGKDKVYNMCEWDNYNWHFVYDPAEDVCDDNTHYWNAVQKRNWNVNDYKDNPYAQWMLVSPEAYKAAMYKATEANPLDVTFLIENPNFTKAKVDGADNWDRGWTGVGTMTGRGRDPWCAIEWYQASADMSQTISGLTPGKYQVSCYGFYRDGSCANEVEKTNNGEDLIQNAFLYANDKEVALPNVSSETGNMPGIGEKDGVKYEFACWPWEANEYFQTGLYKATTPVVEVGEDGELTIGIKSTYNNVGESWVVVGNFRLTYLGVDDVVVGEAGYTTFVAPYNIASIPEGVEAYACQVNENSVHLEPVTAIPAGEAVVLKNAGTYTFRPATSTVELGAENDLLPSDGTVTGAAGNIYALANKTNGIGFYPVSSSIKVPAGKGYLVIGSAIGGAGVKSFYGFDEDDATGIVAPVVAAEEAIYNVAGQRMNKKQKGINIVNGKKILR